MVTFDNEVLPLDRACDVILLYDIQDGHVMVTFNTASNRVTVATRDEVRHISADVTTSATRLGDVTVKYDPSRDTFVVEVAGRLRGRVAGLLGTYTLEGSDEYLMANGLMSASVEVSERLLRRTTDSPMYCTCFNHVFLCFSFRSL